MKKVNFALKKIMNILLSKYVLALSVLIGLCFLITLPGTIKTHDVELRDQDGRYKTLEDDMTDNQLQILRETYQYGVVVTDSHEEEEEINKELRNILIWTSICIIISWSWFDLIRSKNKKNRMEN